MSKRTKSRFIARVVEGSKPASMPGFIKPQLATLRTRAPSGDYVHEVKFDGYRLQAHIDKGRLTLYTRSGLDWTKRFGLAKAFCIPVERAIFDGELVVVHEGRPNFAELQADLANGRQDNSRYWLSEPTYFKIVFTRPRP